MAINTATIQHRRGSLEDFNPDKMVPGELAFTTDGSRKVFAAFAPGDYKELISSEEIQEDLNEVKEEVQVKLDEALEEVDEKISNSSDKANVIEIEKSGETITATDSSNAKFRGMNVYGKSKQNGIPTPDFPQTVVNCENTEVSVYGSNILNPNREKEVFDLMGDGINIRYGYSFVGGKTYYINNTGKDLCFIRTSKKDLSNRGTTYTIDASSTRTINVAKDESLWVFTNVEDFDFSPVCLSLIDTTYEPYNKQSLTIPYALCGIPVSSGGNYIDDKGQMWVCDEVDMERGVYVQRIMEIELDYFNTIKTTVDENWYDAAISYSYELIPFLDNSVIMSGVIGLCSHFKSYNFSGFYNNKIENGIMNSGEYIVINISKSLDICKTVKEFKQWFLDNNVKIIKAMKTPVETPLTTEQIAAYKALHSNYPTTSILNNNGAGMKVKYGADTKLYIDNKFAELAAQLV